MNFIGRKIFYLKLNGQVILNTGEMMGSVRELEVNECFQVYEVLRQYAREEIDVIELAYGRYSQDFAECNGYAINVQTGALEFSYPDPNLPQEEQPVVYQKPLSEQIADLKAENISIQETVDLILTDIIPSMTV